MLERYVRFVVRHRVAVVVAVLLVTALFATQLRHLRLEIRRRAQLPQDHPYVQIQNEIADRFGGETTLIIGIIAREGDIFTPEILQKVITITHKLEGLPGVVPGNLLSLASPRVKSIRPGKDAVDLRPFLETLPHDSLELAQLKHDVLADDIYTGVLVANDGSATAILVDFDETVTDREIYSSVEHIITSEDDQLVQIALGGSPIVRVYSADYTRTMLLLFPLSVLVIGIVHYEAFRQIQAMVLPLLTALVAVIWSLGIICSLGQPLDTWSAITPVVILAIAAGHAVQMLKRYYEECNREGPSELAVVQSICAVGPVMLTAGVIASAGFASLATFGVASVRTFGLLLAAGILSTLLIEMTFIPACRALLSSAGEKGQYKQEGRFVSGALAWIEALVLHHPRGIILATLLTLLASLIAFSGLEIDNSLRAWFPDSSRLRIDDRTLNHYFAGTSTLYVLLEGEAEGDLEDPTVLRAIVDLQSWLKGQPGVGGTLSIGDFVRRMHKAMSGHDAIPESRRLIAQYLFLYSFSGPDDLAHLLDPTHRLGVVRAYAKVDAADFAKQLFARLATFTEARFKGLPIQTRIAGGALGVQAALNEEVVHDKVLNVLQVAAVIFALSALVLRSFIAGILVLAPLLVAVAVSLGSMGVTGTPLSVATATFTAMAASIGADFAVYIIFRLREELRWNRGDLQKAMTATLDTSGRAIFYVSSAVVLGYVILVFSGFRVWVYLGAFTALMMAVAALGALTLVPALIVVAKPRFLWRGIATRVGGSKKEEPSLGLLVSSWKVRQGHAAPEEAGDVLTMPEAPSERVAR